MPGRHPDRAPVTAVLQRLAQLDGQKHRFGTPNLHEGAVLHELLENFTIELTVGHAGIEDHHR